MNFLSRYPPLNIYAIQQRGYHYIEQYIIYKCTMVIMLDRVQEGNMALLF